MTVDLKLDTTTGDLDLSNNTLSLTTTLEDVTRQKLQITLSTFRGEWQFNTLFGVPYLKNDNNNVQLLGKTDPAFADITIKSAILDTDGVAAINQYSSKHDRRFGTFSISFEAITDSGSTVTVNNINI